MPDSTLTCPSCHATLRPKTALAPGARIKCPKCTNVFAVPDEEEEVMDPVPRRPKPKQAAIQKEPDDDLDGGEILDDEPEDEEEPEEDRPVKRKKKKKPVKKGVPLWVWLVGGGVGLMFLLCLGCGGFFYYIGSTVLNAGSGRITLLNYAQVREGASEAQVKALLGEPILQTSAGPGQSKSLMWKDGANIIDVTFADDKAINRNCHLFTSSGTEIKQMGFGHP